MVVELINTGSELMLGRVLNTHQQWLCAQLAELGYRVSRQVAIPDKGKDIQEAVRESLGRADLVISTGGLGPTSDDITRDLVAQMLGRTLHQDATVLANIQQFFAVRKRAMPVSTAVQAMVPEGAIVLANANGTAPGLALEITPNPFRAGQSGSWLVMLPGPPRELRPMFKDLVVPLLRERLGPTAQFVCRTLRTTGLGESVVEQRIARPLEGLVAEGLELGYCARPGQVDVRVSAQGERAEQLVNAASEVIHQHLKGRVFSEQDQEMEELLVRVLTERKQTLALAESCTGGGLANRITNVPGASAVLLGGLVTYSNQAKMEFLGVKKETLAKHGAVSAEVAREMAEGALSRTGANFALSVTGIAGPSGGSAEKPVGTVFIGLAGAFDTEVEKQFNPFDRETFKDVTSRQALDLLRRKMNGEAAK